jgi:signal transduction histidine kinase
MNTSPAEGELRGPRVRETDTGTGEIWAHMLASIADKNCRINLLLERTTRRTSRTVLQEVERERVRIARELHAGAGQPLAGIRMNLDILSESTGKLSADTEETMSRLRRLTESALAEVRAVSHRLCPPAWQTLGAGEAIRALLHDLGAEQLFPETNFDIQELMVEPGHSGKLALYRCAQECISNVIRHAGATRLSISLISMENGVELRIGDNGQGLLPGVKAGSGIGLHAIRDHAEGEGGTCSIETGAEGTIITVRIPYQEN